MHAYGQAMDLNPVENPYIGCGMSRDPARRSVLRPLEDPSGNGHARGDRRLPLDRLGLGRLLVRLDEGLHALLFHGALGGVRDLVRGPARSGSTEPGQA